MRILHTSDWHVGRTFHGHDTLPSLRVVVQAVVEAVRRERVDVVVVAGDVFDRASPSADAFAFLDEALVAIRRAGPRIVLISGNHDGAQRLSFMSAAAAQAGIHVLTRVEALAEPVVVDDEHGPVCFYGVPYLEPLLARHALGDVALRSHAGVLGVAMDRVRHDLAGRGEVRSVVLAHCFVTGGERGETERDIAVGGVEEVPSGVFAGPTYVALGHLHARQQLDPWLRYSGAPLAYAFGERHRPRGAWLVDLDAAGLGEVRWLDLPVPRRLTRLTGPLDALLTDPSYTAVEDDWVEAVLTDPVRPLEAMPRLKARFPHCAHLVWAPPATAGDVRSYHQRLAGRDDVGIAVDFLAHVRNGVAASESERELLREAFEAGRLSEAAR